MKYTFQNVGRTVSAKSISDYLKSERRNLDHETVYSYLEKLEKAYLLHRCSRYDLQGKEIHDNYPKYVLRADAFASGNYEGIKTMHIADFLLSGEY